MNYSLQDGISILSLNAIVTLTLALLLYAIGQWILRKTSFLRNFYLPAPVVGGLLFAFLQLFLHLKNSFVFQLDSTFQNPAMSGFFATVGLSITFQGKKHIGRRALRYWFLCGLMIIGQNLVGVSLALLLGLQPFLGVLAGSASMVGGHGLALSIEATAASLGVAGAQVTAAASATFGLVAGALLGGIVARHLIKRDHLTSSSPESVDVAPQQAFMEPASPQEKPIRSSENFLKHLLLLALILTSSAASVPLLKYFFPDLAIPSSILSMILGLLAGILLKKKPIFALQESTLQVLQRIFLTIFLSIAAMSMRLWELSSLALPLLIILLSQCTFTVLFSTLLYLSFYGQELWCCRHFRWYGRSLLGATPIALANMEAITEQHGPAGDAFLLVPLGGGFLGDLINVPLVLFLLNILT